MAKIVTITNPLTGQPAQVDQLDHTAQQIDDGLNIARGVSNPNLLDNWYFGNPVNQRGQTEYNRIGAGAANTIDRWLLQYATLTLHDGVLTWGNTQTSVAAILQQRFEGTELCGKTLTFSVMHADGTVESVTGVMPTTETSVIVGYLKTETSGVDVQVRFVYEARNNRCTVYMRRDSTPFSMSIKVAKLELGTHQTLAHQDSNGNWVLNEIPDYGEQLRRCQMYQLVLRGASSIIGNAVYVNGKYAYVAVPLPVTMREAGNSVAVTLSGTVRMYYTGGYVDFSGLYSSAMVISQNLVQIIFVSPVDLTSGGVVGFIDNTGELIINRNL